jgi:hypothetical protein
LEIVAHAMAFVLAQRLKALADVKSLQRDIVDMIEVHSGHEAQHT